MKRILFILPALICSFLPVQAQEVLTDTVPRDSAIMANKLPIPKEDLAHTEVVYDPITGNYVIHTKIGQLDISTPYMLTPKEYASYQEQQVMHTYWQNKISEADHSNERKFDITDMKFDIGPADKVFGPGGVQLKLQGSAELLFGFKHQFVDNPSLTERGKNNNIFDFDEKIQASVNAKVGDKLNFNLNYNTEASFDFDQQNLKLNYKGKEDDIIQSIEAGNVSMDLNSSLIRSTQALFGIKTNLQFGKLKIQALISQQRSEAQNVSSEGGAQTTRFEKKIDEYDENRHFFLSHYFRDHYEEAMASLPYIASGVQINKVEVWVTNKRGMYDEARNIVAFVDLGEGDARHILDSWSPKGTGVLPKNEANNLYETFAKSPAVRNLENTAEELAKWDLTGGESYDRIESARRLSSNEYTLNASLGYISLNTTLNPDEVLAVAYEYTSGGEIHQVGEFSTDNGEDTKAPNALFLKLLKGTNTTPIDDKKGKGTWDLMMKNIYSLGAASFTEEKFELNVMYRNDSVGTEMQYLSEGPVKGKQLLRVFNLDRMDQKHNPSPDGKFDYFEGYTVLSSSGRIIFPVLEPFGEFLAKQLGYNEQLVQKYCFQELYDSTLVKAQESSEKNKFTLSGRYKGSSGNEIRLNAMNIPRGSVTVTAGGATLIENVDYTIDYTMGVVTILNQAILDSGTKVDVQLENQSTFSLQQKSLYGVHLEYNFTKDFMIGGTLMHLREKPLTTKVSTGNEPLANTIWGLNLAWKTELRWLTNALNNIPWIEATQPSTFQLNGEFAHLIPGHSKDVGAQGNAYLDDFESTINGIDIHAAGAWFLASTPTSPDLPYSEEGSMKNDIHYNSHRSHLAWYTVDPIFGYSQPNTPVHLKEDKDALSDHRNRIVYERELYPTKQSPASEDTRLACLSLAYYPRERGSYNIDADMIGSDGLIPADQAQNCWGGIMRKLENTDFEKSNIEYIEFWLMDPALTNPDNPNYDFKLYFDLGDISEDILKDGKKGFEHGLPVSPTDLGRVEKTIWGYVPKTNATTTAFDNNPASRRQQDVGLNGLSNDSTRNFEYNGQYPYRDFEEKVKAKVGEARWNEMLRDPFSIANDLAGDKYHYYRGTDYDEAKTSVMDRYKYFNNTEGNSPSSEDQNETYGTAATLMPDVEDINKDNTLNEYERFYEYHVSLNPNNMRIGEQYIVSIKSARVQLANGREDTVHWYQFKIPLHGEQSGQRTIGNIHNFRSIRFMRMFITGTNQETFLRFGTLDLVRGEWRSYSKNLCPTAKQTQVNPHASLTIEKVNIEEDATREPINYVLPPGVSRQTDPGQMQLIAQNEQAMSLKVMNLSPYDARAVYKNCGYDMRNYKRLQMFVHAEALLNDPDVDKLTNGDFSCFIRLGTDLANNYYEYEIPLTVTPQGRYNDDNENDRRVVWPDENMFDFAFATLTDAKLSRNRAHADIHQPYVVYDQEKPENKVTVVGNPTLEEVESIMIGIRNIGNQQKNAEIWVNELRLNTFDERGGVAAMANAALAVSDIAQLNVSGKLETAGYGSIESNVLNRNMENNYNIAVSAAMEVGRLFPAKARIQLPAYVSYTKQTTTPDYNPFDSDVKMQDALENIEDKHQRDSLSGMVNTVSENTSFSVTGAKINIHSKKKDMFYDPANFSVSASYNRQKDHSPEVKENTNTDHKGNFTYSYNFNPKPWEPFAQMEKVQKIRFLKEFNLYYLPQSWSFSTTMHRTFSNLKMRDLTGDMVATATTFDDHLSASKDFTWDRNVNINYNLTKNMKFTFQSSYNGTIDEGKYSKEIIKDQEYAWYFQNDEYEVWKNTIQRSLAKWGSPYTYQQVFTASWNVPFNRIPYLEAITANASYNGSYNWTRTAPTSQGNIDMGNSISSTRTWQVDGGLNLETLYSKSKYWKDMTQFYTGRQRTRNFRPKIFTQTYAVEKGQPIDINHRLNTEKFIVTTTDSLGKRIPVKYKAKDANTITLTSQADCKNLVVTITTTDPNKKTAGEITGNMFAYLGTFIRRIQVTYRETESLTAPGFFPQAGFMGQDIKATGGSAPGFDFAFGFFPKNWIDKAQKNNWVKGDSTVIQPITRAKTTDFDVKLTLEPLPGLKIQVNGKRYLANTSTITLQDGQNPIENMNGSFNISSIALATMFTKIGTQEDNFANSAFDQFLRNRDILQNRVQGQYNDVLLPRQGFMRDLPNDQKYVVGVNGLPVSNNSADVLIPAFLAAYTGKDANKISLNPFLGILNILPNWSVTYDGLSKLPGIRDHFRSFSLTHAYVCKYSIGSYGSYSTWVGVNGTENKQVGFVRDVSSGMPMPSSSYDITNVTLSENFSPLIGLNMSLKNSLNCKFEYRKQRNLAMNITSVQITEAHTDEFVIGAGYTIKNLNFVTKNKNGVQKKVSNDLKLNVDVSYKDIKTLMRKVEENLTQASSGNKMWTLKLSADYVLSQKVSLQLFYDHESTFPLISSSYPVKADNVGINIKLMLTR